MGKSFVVDTIRNKSKTPFIIICIILGAFAECDSNERVNHLQI